MYAFTAFKWGPAWAEQTCFSGKKNPKQPNPPKPQLKETAEVT